VGACAAAPSPLAGAGPLCEGAANPCSRAARGRCHHAVPPQVRSPPFPSPRADLQQLRQRRVQRRPGHRGCQQAGHWRRHHDGACGLGTGGGGNGRGRSMPAHGCGGAAEEQWSCCCASRCLGSSSPCHTSAHQPTSCLPCGEGLATLCI